MALPQAQDRRRRAPRIDSGVFVSMLTN